MAVADRMEEEEDPKVIQYNEAEVSQIPMI